MKLYGRTSITHTPIYAKFNQICGTITSDQHPIIFHIRVSNSTTIISAFTAVANNPHSEQFIFNCIQRDCHICTKIL